MLLIFLTVNVYVNSIEMTSNFTRF